MYLYSGTHLLKLVVEMTSPTQWPSHLRPSSLLLSSHPPLSLWLLNTMWTTLSVLWLPTVLGTVQLLSITFRIGEFWQHHNYWESTHMHSQSYFQFSLRRLSCVDKPHKWNIWTSLQQIARIYSNHPVWCWVCNDGDMWRYTIVESELWNYSVWSTNPTYSNNLWV